MKKSFILRALTLSIASTLLLSPLKANAMMADMEAQKLLPIQSNNIDNWPAGPVISSYSAILIDADTGIVLYEKNADEKMYPASTTKLLTCLLAMEKPGANLNDMVDFSWEAVMTVPRDSSNMGMDAGESITLEECLYGILVVSANEVANAVAEYVSGDISTFVDLMNERAKELGCTNTHFNNAHGYTDSEHYTTARDLSYIAKEFFKNELLSKISRTPRYHWYATDTQPDDFVLGSTNYFMRGRKDCEGIVGSKTGYTDESRNCLVTCAERNGMKLIAVVMRTETPYQYDDTNILLDYGFSNFDTIKVSDYETKYTVTDDTFFHSESAVFGDSSSILSMDTNASIIIPKTISFDELTSTLTLADNDPDKVATVTYSYGGVTLGSADIFYTKKNETAFVFDETDPEIKTTEEEKEPIFIYVNYIIYVFVGLFVFLVGARLLQLILANFHFAERRKASRHWRKRRHKLNPSSKKLMKEDKVLSNKNKKQKKRRSSSYIDI